MNPKALKQLFVALESYVTITWPEGSFFSFVLSSLTSVVGYAQLRLYLSAVH